MPRTEIVQTECKLHELLDGAPPDGLDEFLTQLHAAVDRVHDHAKNTPPFFLRTGQGSGKHNWKRCCYVDFSRECVLLDHVYHLVEWSCMVDFLGLPTNVWCVRELLPVTPIAVLPRYRDMPLVIEYRAFIEAGQVACHHLYWPEDSIRKGCNKEDVDQVLSNYRKTIKDPLWIDPEALALVQRVAQIFSGDGAWSVDLLLTQRGWFVTDMAEAKRSFHWEGCPNQSRKWRA